MKILIVDDEPLALADLKDVIEKTQCNAQLECFTMWPDAIKGAKATKYDVAFLDIEMPEKTGLELAAELKNINPTVNIIFVTGYSDYAVEAFNINASGYILKPAREESVRNALENLRIPIKYDEKKLGVQCFGNFEVFSKNEIIKFKRKTAKEIFAYLVNLKGASANTNELCSVLFDEDTSSNKHYLRNLISDLKNTLERYDANDVFVFNRNSFSIDVSKVECDYYKFLEYDIAAINSYNGEYMNQYSWAEMTNGLLWRNKRQ